MPSCPSIRPFLDISANLGKLFHSNLPGWVGSNEHNTPGPSNLTNPVIVCGEGK